MHTTRLLTVPPSMHYAGGWCLLRGRGCLLRGVPGPGDPWLGMSASGGCLVPGVPGPGGGAWSRGVSAPREWVSAPGRCLVPGGLFRGDLLPADPPREQILDIRHATENITLPKLRLRAVNMVTFTIARRFRHFLWDNVNRYWSPSLVHGF